MMHNRQLWCWLPTPGRPAFRKWRQHANMERSHTTLCPSNARIGYSRYCKSSCGTHSLVLIIQWSSIIVAAIWSLSGDALLHDFSTSTSFVFTHRQFSFKEGLLQFACAEATLIVASVPVEPHSQAHRSYNDNEHLWAWVQHLLDSLPRRCVPVLLLDANGRTGSAGSEAVSLVQPQRQNFNGSLMHDVLLHHHLLAVNTFFQAGDAYYGCFARNSRTDYVCLPQTMRHRIRQCCVLHAAGDRFR